MDVVEAIEKRRAYRSLNPVEISQGTIVSLAKCASLATSCFNNQPWRFIFVVDPDKLHEIFLALSKNNDWFTNALMAVTIFSKKSFKCVMKDGREYFFFNIGIALELLILRVTGMSLVARTIAGESLLF
jgi:nitroreductase